MQERPRGLADAFIVGEEFIGDDSVCLILGDNVFYGTNLSSVLWQAMENERGATIFGYPVHDPRAYGVVEFDKDFKVISIEEKPQRPKSNYAVPGLYLYDNRVIDIAKTSALRARRDRDHIHQQRLPGNGRAQRGAAQTRHGLAGHGFPQGHAAGGGIVGTIQERQGFYVSCIEEIAWRRGFITRSSFWSWARSFT